MNRPLSKETLEEDLNSATTSLLEMSRELTWNKISDNCVYILSEQDYEFDGAARKAANDKKQPKSLGELEPILLELYPDIYEFNLYVYKAAKTQTVIEIQYIFTEATIGINDPPGLHSKEAVPSYASDKKRKFDINWQHNNLLHKWKIFWALLGFKIFLLKRQIRNRK